MEQYGYNQGASPTSCPFQRWQKIPGVLRQPRKKNFLVYLPKGKPDLLHNARGVSYTPKWLQGRRCFVNTVDYNIYKYSERDYTRPLLAQKLQYKIALTSHRNLVKIVEDKVQILNCPLNRDDVRGAGDIWGKNLGCLKGKTPRQNTPHI